MPTLRWLTREDDVKAADAVPYRLLEEMPALSYGERDTGNMLIQGDNLDALKALLPYYAGQVQCIYIDPPYNTGSAFKDYDDNLEHSKWLAIMLPRLELLREFLCDTGTIWISIDHDEAHYLKVIMDELFGRKNHIADVVWQKRTSPDARLHLGDAHDYLLVYGKSPEARKSLNKLPLTDDQAKSYKNPDNDPRGAWVSTDLTGQTGHATPDQFYTIVAPNGNNHEVPEGRCWALAERTLLNLMEEKRIWFGKNGTARPRLKRYLSDAKGVTSWTWWDNKSVGHNQEAKKEINALFGGGGFETPKPERLLQRVLQLATNQGDLVMDTFLGSGTTAAVAMKMERNFIGVEMGEHAKTYCQNRLKQVSDGEQGGISKNVKWQGGSGFRFFKLGPSVFEETGQIRPDIEFTTLASHIWFYEVGMPWDKPNKLSPILGQHVGQSYALLYNGILGDKRVNGGNILTRQTLKVIRDAMGDKSFPIVIYGERSALSESSLKRENITFKQTPYDVKARA